MGRIFIALILLMTACTKQQLHSIGENYAKQNCSRKHSGDEYIQCTKDVSDYYDAKK